MSWECQSLGGHRREHLQTMCTGWSQKAFWGRRKFIQILRREQDLEKTIKGHSGLSVSTGTQRSHVPLFTKCAVTVCCEGFSGHLFRSRWAPPRPIKHQAQMKRPRQRPAFYTEAGNKHSGGRDLVPALPLLLPWAILESFTAA